MAVIMVGLQWFIGLDRDTIQDIIGMTGTIKGAIIVAATIITDRGSVQMINRVNALLRDRRRHKAKRTYHRKLCAGLCGRNRNKFRHSGRRLARLKHVAEKWEPPSRENQSTGLISIPARI